MISFFLDLLFFHNVLVLIVEMRLRLVYFRDHQDVIRCMLHAIAPDDVWVTFSWQGTDTKASFLKEHDEFLTAIKKISAETSTECNSAYCESRIKTFLRHTKERIKRRKTSEISKSEI